MKRNIKVVLAMASLALGACGGGGDDATSKDASAPATAAKQGKNPQKAPQGAPQAPAPVDEAAFVVPEGDVLTPEEARSAAAEEITEENADAAFEELKKAIEGGGK